MIREAFNTDKNKWFRDATQLAEVRRIVHDRLADDRYQQECRYLMRFWWHLGMRYQEVSYQQLQVHLSQHKKEVLEELFDAVDISYQAVDEWIHKQQLCLPLLEKSGQGLDA